MSLFVCEQSSLYFAFARREEIAMSLPLSQVLSSKHINMPTSSFRLLLALTTTLTSAVALQTRRALLRSATAASAASAVTLLPALAAHAAQSGVPEGMRTSESYTNLQQLSRDDGHAGRWHDLVALTTITAWCCLKKCKSPARRMRRSWLVLDGGVVATPLSIRPRYPDPRLLYDVEVR